MTDLPYTGAGPVPNCTPDQAAAVEVLLSMAPSQRRDGLRRAIATALGTPPFTDGEVMAATQTALTDHGGVPVPRALFAGATQAAASTKVRINK
jgi:hypothetical protein